MLPHKIRRIFGELQLVNSTMNRFAGQGKSMHIADALISARV